MTKKQLEQAVERQAHYKKSKHKEAVMLGAMLAKEILEKEHTEQLAFLQCVIDQRTSAMNSYRADLETVAKIISQHAPRF